MRHQESYIKPISLRNVIYSAMITVVGCFGLWGFWRSAIPAPLNPVIRSNLIVRYTPQTAGTRGVTWSSVPIGLPSRIGFEGTAQREASRFQEFLTPPPLPIELGGGQPVDEWNRFRPALEWAESDRPTSDRYEPIPVEPPVFGQRASRTRLPVEWDWMDELQHVRWESMPVINESVIRAQNKPVAITAWVILSADGKVEHVFLESPSGQANLDQAVVRGLMSLRTVTKRAEISGRVRVLVAGRPPSDSTVVPEKE